MDPMIEQMARSMSRMEEDEVNEEVNTTCSNPPAAATTRWPEHTAAESIVASTLIEMKKE
jgi:hypothetical protein